MKTGRLPLDKRITYLDILRVMATMLVIMVHAPIARYAEYGETPNVIYPIYITLITIGSKMFFMVSGALLLPVQLPWKEFVRRRLRFVVTPLALWSGLYLLYRVFTGIFSVKQLISLPFFPIDTSLWFVYVMIVFYVFMPVLSRCLEAVGKRGVQVYLVLWMLSSFIPYQHGMFMQWGEFSHNMFSSFSGYLGYVVMGYYLHHWPLPLSDKRWRWGLIAFSLMAIVALPLFEFTVQEHFGLTYADHLATVTYDISINTIAMGILLFTLAQRFTPPRYAQSSQAGLSPAVEKVAVCSYGIYLCNILLLRLVIWPVTRPWLSSFHWTVDGAVCIVLCAAVSYVFIRGIYHTPFSKYIIGR